MKRTLGGLRAASLAVALASIISACSAHAGSPFPDPARSQSSSRHVLVLITPTPAPTATPGSAGCGTDVNCRHIRLTGLLDMTLTKRSFSKISDATFAYHDIQMRHALSCEGLKLRSGDGNGDRDDDVPKFAALPSLTQVPGPTFFIPTATTLANPCGHRHGEDGGDDEDRDGGDTSHDASFYIAMIGFSSTGVSFQALSGPAQTSGSDLVFPAAPGFATMYPGYSYAFVLVRNTRPGNVLPTPSASPPSGGLGGGLH